MSESEPICGSCGAPAVVRITGEDTHKATLRHLCAQCAEDNAAPSPVRRGLNLAAVLISIGAFVLVISALADVVAFGSSAGFGRQQLAGVGVAGVLVLVGVILRVPTVLVIGLIVGAITIPADRLAFGSSPGFGAQQIAGSLIGVALIALGLVLARTTLRSEP